MAEVLKYIALLRLWVGRYFGIDVYLHWTWLVFAAFIFSYNKGMGCLYIAAFTCVLLHEFGHCLMAKYLGVGVKNVHLFPIGGVAQIELVMDKAYKELPIVIAGPAVNLVLAPIFYYSSGLFDPDTFEWAMCIILAFVNVLMCGFNLLPIFPMDGGRIFRCCWSIFGGNYEMATLVAARLGQVGAIALGVVGVMIGAYMWPMLSLLLMAGAEAELQQVKSFSLRKTWREFNALLEESLTEGVSREEVMKILDRVTDPVVRELMLWRINEALPAEE